MSLALHALVSPENSVATTAMQRPDALPATKAGWQWLPVMDDEGPEYDAATHKVTSGPLVVDGDHVRQTWDVVALNAYELHEAAVAAGYAVSPEGFTLALGDRDRVMFAQMLALVKEALDLGMITDETPLVIADASGQRHEVTTLRFRQIMVGYGLHYKALWDNLTS